MNKCYIATIFTTRFEAPQKHAGFSFAECGWSIESLRLTGMQATGFSILMAMKIRKVQIKMIINRLVNIKILNRYKSQDKRKDNIGKYSFKSIRNCFNAC